MSKDFQRTGTAAAVTILICLALPGRPSGSSAALVTTTPALGSNQTQTTTDTLRLSGLTHPVEVRRDRWGVPHIYAASQSDLFFAQGFVAARDRIFQMEMWRRLGEGRLAEVLGPGYANRDRLARLFRYRGDMQAEWSSYAPDARAIVGAFVAGVNAFIRNADDAALPPEFGLLGFRPEPWDVTVPLSRATGLSGTGNANSEVLRAELVASLGASAVDSLLRTDPPRRIDPVPGLDLSGIGSRSLGGFGAAFSDIAYNRLEGSNNWVVSAAHTNSGMPILANDPHRVITNPAVRYITHLVGPGWNVIGAGEPASPGVAIGHNDRIAFGLTVVGMDQMDVYVEALGPCPSNSRGAGPPPRVNNTTETTNQRNRNIAAPTDSLRCYRYRGAWRPIRRIRDTIHVKGEAPRHVDLEFTVHGPIVSVDTARSRAFALRSVHAEPGTASYLASLSLGRARNWKEFEAAMARWHMPSENMIYADRDGNIGWIAAGLMPRRSWSGLLPVPGDGRFEWAGFVPASQLPRSYNPASGLIATANNNILPAGYTIPVSYEWASRFRIDRVNRLLGAGQKFSVDDFKLMQHDDLSLPAISLLPHLERAAARMGVANRDEIRELVSWNRRMSRDQLAPSLFAAWAPAVWRRIMTQRTRGMPDVVSLIISRTDYERLEEILDRSAEAHDSALVAAVDDGVAELTRRFGSDRKGWGWGTIHTAQFRHTLSSRYDLPAVSRSGDGNTVFATGGANFRQTSGASFREIVDLADFDNSVVTNVPGQSGDPRSPHYSDLLQLWGNNEYFPLVYSRERVEAETRSVLWLFPRDRRR
ncbi:MAG: penicillin acylase family protein [Gemmatimonadota bacterium]